MNEKILELNKKIAEFYKWESNANGAYKVKLQTFEMWVHIESFKFHRDFKWMMELLYMMWNDYGHDQFDWKLTGEEFTLKYDGNCIATTALRGGFESEEEDMDYMYFMFVAIGQWIDHYNWVREPKEFTLDYPEFLKWYFADVDANSLINEIKDEMHYGSSYSLNFKKMLEDVDENEIPVSCIEEQDESCLENCDTLGDIEDVQWSVKEL